MARATWNGTVVAESTKTVLVEGNHYFPPESINQTLFQVSETTTVCGWKGAANYYTLNVDGEQNVDAAWYYGAPQERAAGIKGFVAFWKGVQVEDTPGQEVVTLESDGTCGI